MQNTDPSGRLELPVPDAGAAAHSREVIAAVHAAIEAGDGAISFADYMHLVLHAPGLGYYNAGSHKFGKVGDFVTAPELSDWFSRCVAVQCRQVIEALETPVIIEAGPGSGRMAGEILSCLEKQHSLPAKYILLETSADLRERQQQLLEKRVPHLLNHIDWWETLPEVPVNGLLIANELLDALPVHRVCFQNGEMTELGVMSTGGGFNWSSLPQPNHALHEEIEYRLGDLKSGFPEQYCTEFNLDLGRWIRTLADSIHQGAMLLIDYGYSRNEYYHPQRRDGTLLCHYRHRVHADPFLYPGLQDITSSVDFTAVAEAATAAGFSVSGYTTQAHFLMACGLLDMVQSSGPMKDMEQARCSREIKLLTLPGEMGERFKVMALGKGLDLSWRGFQMTDLRSRL